MCGALVHPLTWFPDTGVTVLGSPEMTWLSWMAVITGFLIHS
jgi:hypothetical protein